MVYDKKGLLRISDYVIQLILPLQLQKKIQLHQIMCGCEICIQDGTYQDSLNNWRNRRMTYTKDNEKSLAMVSVELLNT